MSAEPVEFPHESQAADERPKTLTEAADEITDALPGYRAEIIGGILTVTPSADGGHAEGLTAVMIPLLQAGLHGEETKVLQALGIWLPDGPEDFVIPDLCVVDGDFKEHLAGNGCYAPEVVRLALEVTSGNHNNDLRTKVVTYARAGIPVYVIVNLRHGRIHVLTDPEDGEYQNHCLHARGAQAELPDSLGAKVTLDVTQILDAGKSRTS